MVSAKSGRQQSNYLIRAKDLCKSFDHNNVKIEVLKGVNFDLKKGETAALVGASGIGKSTFLHILGTLERPDSGTLMFQGEHVLLYNNENLAKFRNKSIGFVFQFHYLLAEFSAIENTMIPVLINGNGKEKARELAEEILVRVGLKDRLNHNANRLSGGEQQRVALARALVMKPAILLADEPTGNLDRKNSAQIHDLLAELNREFNMTLVIVTHNPDLASFFSRTVTIIDGQVVSY